MKSEMGGIFLAQFAYMYTLEYSIGDPVVLFEWLGLPDGRTPVTTNSSSSLTISSDSSTSWLQFGPLQQSHSGSYSCRATTSEGAVSFSEPVQIQVNGINLTNYGTQINILFHFTFSSQNIYSHLGQHQQISCNCRRRLSTHLWYTCWS